jgi:hypothetical protein
MTKSAGGIFEREGLESALQHLIARNRVRSERLKDIFIHLLVTSYNSPSIKSSSVYPSAGSTLFTKASQAKIYNELVKRLYNEKMPSPEMV